MTVVKRFTIVFILFFTPFSFANNEGCVEERSSDVLSSYAEKICQKNPRINKADLEKIIQWSDVFKPDQENESFNIKVISLMDFFSHLHPSEQEIYLTMIEFFKWNAHQYSDFNAWFQDIEGYQSLYTSNDPDVRLRYYQSIPPSVWEGAVENPKVYDEIMSHHPISEDLMKYSRQWQWDIWQHSRSEAQILEDPFTWSIEESGCTFRVLSQIVVKRDRASLLRALPTVKDEIFKRIFLWPMQSLSYNEDDQMLTVGFTLATGKPYELQFSVLEDENKEFYDLYYTLQIPMVSKIFFVLSQWEITVRVKPHPAYAGLSILDIRSTTIVNFEKAKEILKLKEVSARVEREFPQKLTDFIHYLEELK